MLSLIKKFDFIAVTLLGALLFVPFLGSVHLFDWDEINFAESAREMLVSGDYQKVQINYQPFTEKPPLFFWLQALSMHLFGVNEFAARFPNAMTGIATLLFIYAIGKKYFGQFTAFIWVLFVTGSFTPHLYFKTGIIDPLYNIFIFISIYQLFLLISEKRYALQPAALLGFFTGLAIITKGPVALIVVVLCFLSVFALNRLKPFFRFNQILICALSMFFTSAIWFGVETVAHGTDFLVSFIAYQADLFLHPVAGHGQPFWYHPAVLLVGAFPASVFSLQQLFRPNKGNEAQTQFVQTMQVFFWVVLTLFSIVTTKIVHYSSLCYLPLTFFAARACVQVISQARRFPGWQITLFLVIGSIVGIILCVLPFTDVLKPFLINNIDDEFVRGNLTVTGGWSALDVFVGVFFLTVIFAAAVQFYANRTFQGLGLHLVFFSLLIPTILRVLVPHIEAYSQRSAIEFYEAHQQEDCYLETVGFKSYAQYFYGRVRPWHQQSKDESWLLSGDIDKPAYFVLKVGDTQNHVNASMQELYSKGGFIFYKRMPSGNRNLVLPPNALQH